MTRLVVVLIVIATLFVVGQLYLRSRRRKAAGLIERLATSLGGSLRGNHIDLLVGSHHVVLDSQVTRDDRPEELRLTLVSNLLGDFRLTEAAGAEHYDDCRFREPAEPGEPFAGWHLHSEVPDQLVALASDGRILRSLEGLAALGFTRIELGNRRLRAHWPDFSRKPDDHDWDARGTDALPERVRGAAEALSELTWAAEAALGSRGSLGRGLRIRVVFTALMLVPILLMVAGLFAIFHLYDAYPILREGRLLALMGLAGSSLALICGAISFVLLRRSIQRGARAVLVGFLSLFGCCLFSGALILWWNGTGPQGPAQAVTVEVVRLQRESALTSFRGRILQELIGEGSPIEEWAASYRAVVPSWHDDSLYGITLSAEDFEALASNGGSLSLTVLPGALGLEWYSQVVVLGRAGP